MSQNPDRQHRPEIPATEECAHVRAKVAEPTDARDLTRGAREYPLQVSRFFPPFSR